VRRTIALLLAVLILAPETPARDNTDWSNVKRLKPGTRVLLTLWNDDQIEGRLEAASDTGLIVSAPEGTRPSNQWTRAVDRGTVRRVVRWRGRGDLPDPGKVMLIGAGAGVAAGAITGGIQDATGRNQARGLGYGLAGGAIGFLASVVVLAAIGGAALAKGPARSEVIYEDASPRPVKASG
jgi:hypothetical protein